MKACPGCHRHVRASESCCPFCAAPLREDVAPRLAAVLGLAAMLAGCGDPDPGMDSGATPGPGSSSSGEEPGNTVTSGGTEATGSFDTGALDTDATANDSSGGGGFIYGSPDGGEGLECDLQQNDCPEGEKCSPWAADGGDEWNGTRCVPVVPDPAGPGQPCLVEGSPVSGLDDCDVGSVCIDVDPTTLEGVCEAICQPPVENSPTCEANEWCVSLTAAFVPLCVPTCDLAAPECPPGTECFGFGEVEGLGACV